MRPDGSPSGSSAEPAQRLFFALWPPATVAEALHEHAQGYAALHGGRVMRCDTLHLTLQFLGATPASVIPQLLDLGSAITSPAFALEIDRLDYWPGKRILWAGSATIPRQAIELVSSLASALQISGNWPITNPARTFVPHLTLIRHVGVPVRTLPPLPALRWHCDRFVLVRSHRSARGADYENIGEWRLR